MKCCICGAESGKYPLCKACNRKRENGEIIKCEKCDQWHYANQPCAEKQENITDFLYEPKRTLISKTEESFFSAISHSVPENYHVFPQINLATFIKRTDNARWHNELFRNIDFLITNAEYQPKIVVEINDQTHLNTDRKERDQKVHNICEEAGIPILVLWTSYGVNQEYIKKRIDEILASPAAPRVHHFTNSTQSSEDTQPPQAMPSKKKNGCYIATCVYGSYHCPEVWLLRRYRDCYLRERLFGRIFIRCYYAVSPTLVRLFGRKEWFHSFWRKVLDRKIEELALKGYSSEPYFDR